MLKQLQDFAASAIQDDDTEFSYDVADAIEKLSVLVRVQKEKEMLDKFPRLIPVAERLPENAGAYLGQNQHSLWVFEEPDVYLYKALTDTNQKTARELLNTQQKTAKWKLHKDGSGTCSECHRRQIAVWDMDNWQKYCGACGAKMIETEQEENKP